MFNNRVDESIREFDYRLQAQGMNLDNYMKYTGMDIEAMRSSMMPQAERQVKVRLALEKVAALENIVASEEDINAELEKMAKSYNMTVEQIKPMIPADELGKDIAVEKAIAFIRENAEITEE